MVRAVTSAVSGTVDQEARQAMLKMRDRLQEQEAKLTLQQEAISQLVDRVSALEKPKPSTGQSVARRMMEKHAPSFSESF